MGKIDRRAPFHSHTVLKTAFAVAKVEAGLQFLNTNYNEFAVNSRKIIRQFAFYIVGTK